MEDLCRLQTVEEVEARIAEICRHMPDSESFKRRAKEIVDNWRFKGSSIPRPDEPNPKLEALCKAFERQAQIEDEEEVGRITDISHSM